MRNPVLAVCLAASFVVAPSAAFALQYFSGSTDSGALYGVWVPDPWNGDLVLYAHGFRNPNCPLAVPTTPEAMCAPLAGSPVPPPSDSGTPQAVKPMRDALLSMGYAFAASSYSDTALALKEGALQTLQLKTIVQGRVGRPRRTWLYGHSMGGAIVLKLAEQHPAAFDGALAMCGMIGGSPTEFQYVADGRATFDVLFPGLVPGGIADVPPGLTFYGDVAKLVGWALHTANPSYPRHLEQAKAWAGIDQVAFPFTSDAELTKGILEFLYFQTLGTPKLLEGARGIPVDNSEVVYGGAPGLDYDFLNRAVERVTADPQSARYAERYYDTTGEISFPVITLHTVRDAAVPMIHEHVYRKKVDEAGMGELLVQRTVSHDPLTEPPDGHCTFKLAEELAAFSDLVSWVETGVRPAEGDATAR